MARRPTRQIRVETGDPRLFITVDPAMAQHFLDQSDQTECRSITKRNRIVTDMRQGRFDPNNGERLKFGDHPTKDLGGLMDGYTRLSALVRAGATYRFEIVTGLPPAANLTTDGNITPRTGRHILMMNHVFEDPKANGPAETALKLLSWVQDYGMDKRRYSSMPVSQQLTMQALDRFPEIDEAWQFVSDYPGLANVVMYQNALLLYCLAVRTGHVDQARDFLSGIATWNGLFENSPCYQVRQRLSREVNDRHPVGSKATTQMAKLNIMVKGWNAFFPAYNPDLGQNSGDMPNSIRYTNSENMPKFLNVHQMQVQGRRTVNRGSQANRGLRVVPEAAE